MPLPVVETESWCWATNVAVTVLSWFMVTLQAPEPEHPPPQFPKREPLASRRVRLTGVPELYVCLQSLPQLIRPSPLVTVPVPLPPFCTVSAKFPGGFCVKVAVTDLAGSIVTTQVPVPGHPDPLQPAKLEPAEGLAVRVTEVPLR